MLMCMVYIISHPTVPFEVIRSNVPESASPWYLRAIVALWDMGVLTSVDPVVLAAQCAHETAWGNFGGAVTEDMGNTCGLKVRNTTGDRREDHASFPIDDHGYPYVGALAHAHHLRLYAGLPIDLEGTPDPRAVWIRPGTSNFGSARTVEALGGKWAPSKSYGEAVAGLVWRLSVAR